ncbi:TMEM175 family protein [Lactococcus lactis]|jgi:Predicted integral membrane protein|uniref:TMEM175 family protein n=1 Tax=Lactococcus lactis TaxID=1358 RepID=UPI0022E6CC76|nr:TMEM175 family protein [Lactococcus lactis]
MKKSRIEAFTDAIVAIILTIMVLEIKVPEETSEFSALLEKTPYFIAFIISFIFICAAWYHHHYLLAKTKWFSRRAFWANNLWLLIMALIPLSTAWVSEFPLDRAPEYFYFIVYALWAGAYYLLNWVLYLDNRQFDEAQALSFNTAHRKVHQFIDIFLLIVGLVSIYFIPVMGLIVASLQVVTWIIYSPLGSDKIEIDE